MLKKLSALLLFSITAGSHAQLLLSGTVEAKNSQVFVTPKADSWQMQIEWMVDEGEKIKKGDTVVVYDTSSLAANVEQLESTLRRVTAEAKRNVLVQDLVLKEAENRYETALLTLKKAELDAGIPEHVISQFQYANNQLALKRALQEQAESTKALEISRKNALNEKKRSELEVASAKNELKRVQLMLDNMTQTADRDGTAMYVLHPWTRAKIRVGDMVQRGFSVLEIPSTEDLHVKAWLNEVDVAKISMDDSARLTFDAKPELNIAGRIVRIGNQAEKKEYWGDASYIDVDIEFDQSHDHGLIPGMSVLVQIGGDT